MNCTRGAEGCEFVTDSKRVYFVNDWIFVATLKRLAVECNVTNVRGDRQCAFAAVRLHIDNIAFAVGVVDVPVHAKELPGWLVEAMPDAVRHEGVRMLTGCFGDTRDAMRAVGQECGPLASAWPLAQYWEGDTSAVADQLTFPVHTLLLGKCKRVTWVANKDHLSFQKAFDEKWVPAVGGLPTWRLPHWHTPWDQAGDMCWGNVTMKAVAPAKWCAGVYQLVFWCGTAKQGYGVNLKGRAEVEGLERRRARRGVDSDRSCGCKEAQGEGGEERISPQLRRKKSRGGDRGEGGGERRG